MTMISVSALFCGALSLALLSGCGSVSYVTGEMRGGSSVKPLGGISEQIPVTKTYRKSPEEVRRAVVSSPVK